MQRLSIEGPDVSPSQALSLASSGTAGAGRPLPYIKEIQPLFAPHDLSGIQAYSGLATARAAAGMGAKAFTLGEKVGFAESAPDKATVIHETTHVLQQRAGLRPAGGLDRPGDALERQAEGMASGTVGAIALPETLTPAGVAAPIDSVQRLKIDGNTVTIQRVSTGNLRMISGIMRGDRPVPGIRTYSVMGFGDGGHFARYTLINGRSGTLYWWSNEPGQVEAELAQRPAPVQMAVGAPQQGPPPAFHGAPAFPPGPGPGGQLQVAQSAPSTSGGVALQPPPTTGGGLPIPALPQFATPPGQQPSSSSSATGVPATTLGGQLPFGGQPTLGNQSAAPSMAPPALTPPTQAPPALVPTAQQPATPAAAPPPRPAFAGLEPGLAPANDRLSLQVGNQVIHGYELLRWLHGEVQRRIGAAQTTPPPGGDLRRIVQRQDWLRTAGSMAGERSRSTLEVSERPSLLGQSLRLGTAGTAARLVPDGNTERILFSGMDPRYTDIVGFLQRRQLDDRQVATALLERIQGGTDTRWGQDAGMSEFLNGLNALLLGVEGSRVNTTFGTALAILDLISNGRLSFQDAFARNQYGGFFPMAALQTGRGNLGIRRVLFEDRRLQENPPDPQALDTVMRQAFGIGSTERWDLPLAIANAVPLREIMTLVEWLRIQQEQDPAAAQITDGQAARQWAVQQITALLNRYY